MPFGKELRREHGNQRQRDQPGEGDGCSEGDAEFTEQPPHVARHEGNRYEYGHQYHRGCDDRKADFPAALDRGEERRLAKLHLPDDVLQNDDGVVNHQADGQDEAEQGQCVDGVAESCHHDECRNNRHGDRYGGNDRCPDRADEGKDDDQHQDQWPQPAP